MKTTMDKAISAAQIVNRLNAIRMKSTATARKIFTLKKLLEQNMEFYIEEERKAITDLGGTIADDGTIHFDDQEEGMRKLTEARRELLNSECDIPLDPPIIIHDSEGVQVSGMDIEVLDGLIDFKE